MEVIWLMLWLFIACFQIEKALANDLILEELEREHNVRLVTWVNNDPYYIYKRYGRRKVTHRGFMPNMMGLHYFMVCQTVKQEIIDDPKYHLQTHNELIDLITDKNTTRIKERLNITDNVNDFVVVSSSTFSKENLVNPLFKVRLLTIADGLGVLVRAQDITLIIKFFKGMKKCLGITWFSILCAIIVASVIWFIENRQGSKVFPDTFGRGLWASFWYCFVTMTTVGYGDKVPKHFLTRILCIIWMWFGLMLTAVITSTVMDAMQTYTIKENKWIGVLNNSAESDFVHSKLSGKPKPYASYNEIIDGLRNKEVFAAMVDIQKAAVLTQQNKDIEIEQYIEMSLSVNVFVYVPWKYRGLEECEEMDDLNEVVVQHQEKIRAIYVPTYQATSYVVNGEMGIHGLRSTNYIFYISILAGTIVIVAVVSEIKDCFQKRSSLKKQQKELDSLEDSPECQRIKEMGKQFQAIVEAMIRDASLENDKRKSIMVDETVHINNNTAI